MTEKAKVAVWECISSTHEVVLPPYRATIRQERDSYCWSVEPLNSNYNSSTGVTEGEANSAFSRVVGYCASMEKAQDIALNTIAAAVYAYETSGD